MIASMSPRSTIPAFDARLYAPEDPSPPFPQTNPSSHARSSFPTSNTNCLSQFGLLELLAEQEELNLIVDREHTSTSHTTEDVSAGTLEERVRALGLGDLFGSIPRGLVFNGLQEIHVRTPRVIEYRHDLLIRTSPEVIIIRRRMVSRG